jgi:S1-C subfamily serine protease
VLDGSPAAKAGVQPGDILVAVNGTGVKDSAAVLNVIAALQPGARSTLSVIRDRGRSELQVTIGRRPKPAERE